MKNFKKYWKNQTRDEKVEWIAAITAIGICIATVVVIIIFGM